MLHPDFERVLISREEIATRVRELAAELDRDYAGKNPLFITILKGSVFFFTDLLGNLNAFIFFKIAGSRTHKDFLPYP